MKKTIIILLTITLMGCLGVITPRIDQEIAESLVCTETKLKTKVWYKGEIVWSRYDNIEEIDSALIERRYRQAEEIVKLIKTCH